METRTSHSSPCFLRVAEASAASSASKMISLSTLFSFETASTTSKISLFMVCFLTTGALNRALPISASFMLTEKLSTSISMLSPSVRRSMPVYRLRPSRATCSSTFTRSSDELREMLGRAQHAIQSRRRNLERIRTGKRIVGIEQFRQHVARFAAVVDIDPFGMVDIDAQRSAALPRHELDFDEFVSAFHSEPAQTGR